MGPEVHWRLTRHWAREAGFSEQDAEVIAKADLAFDARFPARASLKNITRHFAPTAWLWSAHHLRNAIALRDLEQLGFALHCAQDAVSHGTAGEKHLVFNAGWGRDPDVWDAAPAGIRLRIEQVTRERLTRYLAATRAC
jgi:hypothetical protein